MKRFQIWVLATLAVAVVGAWSSASLWAQPPAAPKPLPARYQVVPYSHNSAVMIDVQTGQSWKLQKDAGEGQKFVWVPIRKLETNMEIDDWEQRMKKFRAERRKRREAEFGDGRIVPFGAEPLVDEPPVPLEFGAEPVLEVDGKPLEIVEEFPEVNLSPKDDAVP